MMNHSFITCLSGTQWRNVLLLPIGINVIHWSEDFFPKGNDEGNINSLECKTELGEPCLFYSFFWDQCKLTMSKLSHGYFHSMGNCGIRECLLPNYLIPIYTLLCFSVTLRYYHAKSLGCGSRQPTFNSASQLNSPPLSSWPGYLTSLRLNILNCKREVITPTS